MAHRKKRRSHRRTFSNPLKSLSGIMSAPREMVSKDFLVQAASTAAGFMLPNIAMSYLPATLISGSKIKYYGAKVLTIAALSAAAGMINKKYAKAVLLGGGVSLLIEAYAEFHQMMAPAPAPAKAAGTNAYYGPNLGAFYGGPQERISQYYGPGISDDLVLSADDQLFGL